MMNYRTSGFSKRHIPIFSNVIIVYKQKILEPVTMVRGYIDLYKGVFYLKNEGENPNSFLNAVEKCDKFLNPTSK